MAMETIQTRRRRPPSALGEVFEYLDYRAFLSDYYDAKKADDDAFSFRAFSKWVGVRSPGHLKRIIVGERSLTPEMADRYSQVIGLSAEQAAFFATLVRFNDAKNSTDKESAYQALRSYRQYRKIHALDDRYADYHGHWYLPAIRELAQCHDFVADPSWIASRLRPSISQSEATEALGTLFELGLLRKDGERVVPTEEDVSTGPQTSGTHITRYHRQMLELASASIDNFPAAQRDLSALTLSVPKGALAELRERLRELRQELLTRYHNAAKEQVVQINLQLFPLSESAEPGDKS